jgi:hypothetical protein
MVLSPHTPMRQLIALVVGVALFPATHAMVSTETLSLDGGDWPAEAYPTAKHHGTHLSLWPHRRRRNALAWRPFGCNLSGFPAFHGYTLLPASPLKTATRRKSLVLGLHTNRNILPNRTLVHLQSLDIYFYLFLIFSPHYTEKLELEASVRAQRGSTKWPQISVVRHTMHVLVICARFFRRNHCASATTIHNHQCQPNACCVKC